MSAKVLVGDGREDWGEVKGGGRWRTYAHCDGVVVDLFGGCEVRVRF